MAAARNLFATNGYSATAISDIVERAGTSVGLPYYHFGSKKQIFLAIWEEYLADQEAGTKAAVARARAQGLTGADVLLAATRAYLESAWEHRDIQPMLYRSDKPSGFDAAFDTANAAFLRRNERLLAKMGPQRARIAAILVVNAMRGLCVELAQCSTERAARELIDTGLVLLARMLDAEPAD